MRYLYLTLFLASFMVSLSSCHKQESAEPIITPDTVKAASVKQITATQVNGHVRIDNDIRAYEGALAGILNAGFGEVLNYSNNYFTFYVTYTPHDSIKFTSSGAIFGQGVVSSDFINVKFKNNNGGSYTWYFDDGYADSSYYSFTITGSTLQVAWNYMRPMPGVCDYGTYTGTFEGTVQQ